MTAPVFSVVIATHGRPVKLRRCLMGLARMRFPADGFEVIVVDDGSPEPVGEALGTVRPCPRHVTHLRQKNAGPGIARNAGVDVARGRWIAFIDDDCIPDVDWLTELERALEKHPNHLVGGRVINGYPNSLLDTASWVLLDYLYEYMDRTPTAPRFFATMNVGVSRVRFQEIGGFATSMSQLAEDRDLCDRWAEEGRRFHYEPRAMIRHFHGLTLWKFLRQHAKYGRGARRFHIMHATRRRDRIRLEPKGFYLGLICAPLRLQQPLARRVVLVGCMLLSQVAMVAGYGWDAFVNRRLAKG